MKRCITENNLFAQLGHTIEFIDTLPFSASLITLPSCLWYPFFFATISQILYQISYQMSHISYNILISKDLVMTVFKTIDPTSTEQRKPCKLKQRKYLVNGTNEIWYADVLNCMVFQFMLQLTLICAKYYGLECINPITTLLFQHAILMRQESL